MLIVAWMKYHSNGHEEENQMTEETSVQTKLIDELVAALTSTDEIVEPEGLEPLKDGEEVIGVLPERLQRLLTLVQTVAIQHDALKPPEDELEDLRPSEYKALAEKLRPLHEKHAALNALFQGCWSEEFPNQRSLGIRAGFQVVKLNKRRSFLEAFLDREYSSFLDE